MGSKKTSVSVVALVRAWLLNVVYSVLDHIPPMVWDVLHVFADIFLFWTYKFMNYIRPRSRMLYYEAIKELDSSESYDDWCERATIVDEITGANLWRRNFFSRRYDFRSVLEQYASLTKNLNENDIEKIKEKFSTTGPCMLRNFAGIVDKKLFTKSLMGTKLLIEQHLERTIDGLDVLDKSMTPTSFFQRCKLSLGTTALILQGGSFFGLFHLGVIKALLSQNLMPNIISGSSMGACIASVFGCLSNEELSRLLTGNVILDMIRNDMDLVRSCGYGNMEQHVNLGKLVQNLIHHGYSQDVYLFIQFVLKYIVKDMTFEEAYQATGKAFNVVIHPIDKSCPNLLNYVTTPNVLIRSAIECSLGSGVLSSTTKLLCKNLNNDTVPFLEFGKAGADQFLAPEQATNLDDVESPYTRLTELFNVNNFIVSLAKPYLAPLVGNDLKHEIKTSKYYYYKHYPQTTDDIDLPELNIPQLNFTEMEPLAFKFKYHLERKLKNIATMEFRHRMEVLDNLGLLFPFIKRLIIDEKTPRSATEIAIVPKIKSLSVTRIIEGQLDNIPYWIKCGEQSTWPVLSLLKTRCAVELKLNEIIKMRRGN
ncbi:Lipase 3 [Nakaseomyces glabratus]|uniref:Lipase 3 n=1 Tax=Candida glabrata TaxID=5478 RepID=A0A0W0CD09_CANGB|nr:Patatin-like phospholipase [Nakaseomyces glabratus]KAH7593078.1 Patatin-like phospholipase [Nakaseomyces glabratus]KAH7610922.1 Patatin-like phospholipase [Nakaseomyces glabratus]KTA97341.1 Lipase 3 [Nakaseomyces glabratus]KTA98496.1 Lipase 3 [Nakaseomyces glabratus]